LRLGPNWWRGGGELRARNKRKEESIARRSRRSRRGEIEVGAKLVAGRRRAAAEKQAQGREHRTEVTEVTERELRLRPNWWRGGGGLRARNKRKEESIRTEGTERGIEVGQIACGEAGGAAGKKQAHKGSPAQLGLIHATYQERRLFGSFIFCLTIPATAYCAIGSNMIYQG
jgi:hypothetical protein